MKNIFLKIGFFLFIGLLITYSSAKSQSNINVLLEIVQEDKNAGTQDANTLLEGYMSPLMHGLGIGMNNGWFNTAAPHKSFGMDIGFVAGLAFVPDDELTFRPTNMNLIDDPQSDLPTIFGSSIAPQPLNLKSPRVGQVEMIPGIGMKDKIGFNAVPFAVPQIGLGIVKGTDIKFRFLPETSISNNSTIGLLGFGILHDIKQYLPVVKKIPFDLSVMVGYTKISMNMDLEDPNTGTVGNAEIGFNSLIYQALISKKLSVITLYGGLGFSSTNSGLKLLGDYDLDKDGVINLVPSGVDVQDPIDLSFKKGTPKFTAGFRLKLAIFTLNFDYTLQKYQSFNMGFGFSFRENDGGTI
ncbi:MAG: hypothetical protein OEW67_11485 [Cyclobacteriaceae bacterium]|nr:hypothetical protein [Cyclobacteriaceae bacterium]